MSSKSPLRLAVLTRNYLFTTLTALPLRNAERLLTAVSINRALASLVAHAICGVIMQFLAEKRGLSFCGGYIESTSIPAPAITSLLSASARSSSTTIGPLEVFKRNADLFIVFKLSLFIKPVVSGNKGQ